MAIRSWLAAAVPVVLTAAACGVPPAAPSDLPPPAPLAPSAPEIAPDGKPDAASGADGATGTPGKNEKPGRTDRLECGLPAPRKSDDACKSDEDCGPSSPCHAKACVAKAKSQPAGPDTICTKSLECDSADANRCGCYEGRCALIPPSP